MSGWDLTWEYAGLIRVYPVTDVLWTERQDLYQSSEFYRVIQVEALPADDQHPALLADRYSPIGSLVSLSFNGADVYRGSVSQCQYGPASTAISLEMLESGQSDEGEFPTAAQRKTVDVIKKVTKFNRPPGSRKRQGVVHSVVYEYETDPTVVTEDLYPTAPGRALGVVIPRVWGAPGNSVNAGSPAVVIETTAGSVTKLAIADSRVSASTVTIWGRNNKGQIASKSGVSVSHEANSQGLTYAYVSVGAWTASSEPDPADADGDFYVSWTDGEARPGDATSVLRELLDASSLPYDTDAIEGLRGYLSGYKIDGFVNEYARPTEFLTANLVPMLPIVTSRTVQGISVHPWPWRTGEPARYALVQGDTVWRDGSVTYGDAPSAAPSVTVRYCYNPQSGQTHYTRTANTANDAAALAAQSRNLNPAAVSDPVELWWTWDPQTASRVARDRLERQISRPRRIRYVADAAEHGLGGRRPLRAGLPVTITDPAFGWSARQATIVELTFEPNEVTVTLELRDDPLTAGLV